MTLPGPFSNPVLYVVSIDRFPFENNKKNLAPQSKMLGESESHQKCKKIYQMKSLKLKNPTDFLIKFKV